ncbi:MAG: pilus assembly protein TadG-related protein [Planctomycetota bacterium]
MVMVVVVILGLVLVGFMGLAIDGAFVFSTKQQLQNASDAAALAAARVVKYDGATSGPDTHFQSTREAAIAIASSNSAAADAVIVDANLENAPEGDIVVGRWDKKTNTFTPTELSPNAVQVRARRASGSAGGPLSLLFGGVFGSETADVGAVSTAVLMPKADPLILVLNLTKPNSLMLNGTNWIDVSEGSVHVNSNNACGMMLVGTPLLSVEYAMIVGDACYPEGSVGGSVYGGADVMDDPLADVLPDVPSWNTFKSGMPMPLGAAGEITGPGTYDPGYYPKGLDLEATDHVILNPGYYMFGGQGIDLKGGSFVSGDGVVLLIDMPGGINVAGDAAGMQLTPPAAPDFFQGATIFFHRQITAPNACYIGGGGLFQVQGIIYVPNAGVVLAGTPGKEIGAIIADEVSTAGTAGFYINGKGVPSNDDAEHFTYLVQ